MFVAAIGKCEGNSLKIVLNGQTFIDAQITELKQVWSGALESALNEVTA